MFKSLITCAGGLVLLCFASHGWSEDYQASGDSGQLPGRTTDPDIIRPPGKVNPASGAPAEWSDSIKDNKIFTFSKIDRLEYGVSTDPDNYLWDAEGWIGGDFNKFWWKTEGEGEVSGNRPGAAEFQALYNRTISPFFGLQAGIRYDIYPNPDRGFAVLGFQGLAPQWFETDNAMFVSEDGDVSFRGEYEYEWLITQRLRLAPRLEINISAQDVPEYGLGAGLSDTELGLRLRYAIRREFAPYIGIRYEQTYFDTRDFAEEAGEPSSIVSYVIGVRAWF